MTDRRLTVVTHPLVQHKLSYLRDKDTPTVHFRKLANEITLLLTYEATKDFPTETVEIETPLEKMDAQRISGKKVAVCPVLRAGVGMLEGTLSLISSARVGFIGMYRDEETLEAIQYYVKLPDDLGERDAIVLDPMLATGNSSVAAIEHVKEAGARSVTLVCLVAAPEGIARVHAELPRRPHRLRGAGPRAERARLHRPGPGRRGRPAVRHEVVDRVWWLHRRSPLTSTVSQHVGRAHGQPEVIWGCITALVITVLLTPAVAGMARRLGAVDVPDERRVHRIPIPRLGGLAMFFGIIVPSLAFLDLCRAACAGSCSAPPSRPPSARSTTSAAFAGGRSSAARSSPPRSRRSSGSGSTTSRSRSSASTTCRSGSARR